jgi:hypothetical protein
VGHEVPGSLAGVPLHRVQPVGAVGDVGGADRLAGGDEVLQPLPDERAERDLERVAVEVDARIPSRSAR